MLKVHSCQKWLGITSSCLHASPESIPGLPRASPSLLTAPLLTVSRSQVAMLYRRQWDGSPMSRQSRHRPIALPHLDSSPSARALLPFTTLHLYHFFSAFLPLCFSRALDVSIRIIRHFPCIMVLYTCSVQLSSVSHGPVFSVATPHSQAPCSLYPSVAYRLICPCSYIFWYSTICAVALPFLAL